MTICGCAFTVLGSATEGRRSAPGAVYLARSAKCPRLKFRSHRPAPFPWRQLMPSRLLRVLASAALFAATLLPWPAQAQYPNQTIKIIVTHPAGGLPDTVARI